MIIKKINNILKEETIIIKLDLSQKGKDDLILENLIMCHSTRSNFKRNHMIISKMQKKYSKFNIRS